MKKITPRPGKEWWDTFCELPRFAFFLGEDENGNPRIDKTPFPTGLHVEEHSMREIVDAMQDEINELQRENEARKKRLTLRAV